MIPMPDPNLSWWVGKSREDLNREARERAPAMSARDVTVYRRKPSAERIVVAEQLGDEP